jgi:hypothetical protein
VLESQEKFDSLSHDILVSIPEPGCTVSFAHDLPS